MTTNTKHSWFARKLREAMDVQGVSVRALARAWRPDADVEVSRRSLNRYLRPDGVVPGLPIRRELAAALKVDPLSLEQDDDRETELVAALLNRLIRRHVRELLEKSA